MIYELRFGICRSRDTSVTKNRPLSLAAFQTREALRYRRRRSGRRWPLRWDRRSEVALREFRIPFRKLRIPFLKLDLSFLKLPLSSLKLHLPFLKLRIPYSKRDLPLLKLDLPHWKLHPSYLKLRIGDLKLHLPCLKLPIRFLTLDPPHFKLPIRPQKLRKRPAKRGQRQAGFKFANYDLRVMIWDVRDSSDEIRDTGDKRYEGRPQRSGSSQASWVFNRQRPIPRSIGIPPNGA